MRELTTESLLYLFEVQAMNVAMQITCVTHVGNDIRDKYETCLALVKGSTFSQ